MLNPFLISPPFFVVGVPLSNSEVCTLTSLPKLKGLGVKPAGDFFPTDIQEMENLLVCCFDFDTFNQSARIPVVSMLEKMPNLKFLGLLEDYQWNHGDINDIIFRVLVLAASQNKYVAMEIFDFSNNADHNKMLIVDKRSEADSDTDRRFLLIRFLPVDSKFIVRSLDKLLKDVTVFLNENLKDYYAFLIA